ncbi:MAG: hypothetical protein MUO58_07340 [Anaerolineales bacterium]|nr:hypothetical protein [Anaerolineales bacterium]
MKNLTTQDILTILFGITTAIFSVVTLRYMILEHRRKIEGIIAEGRMASLFLNRDAMLTYLLGMYDRAVKGDTIWGQCVGCSSYSKVVRSKVHEAAGQGANYRMIVNKYAPTVEELRKLYDPLSGAEVAVGEDNSLRIQGLSNKEVVMAFPGIDSYTAVLIRDPHFISIIKNWFDIRFDSLAGTDPA